MGHAVHARYVVVSCTLVHYGAGNAVEGERRRQAQEDDEWLDVFGDGYWSFLLLCIHDVLWHRHHRRVQTSAVADLSWRSTLVISSTLTTSEHWRIVRQFHYIIASSCCWLVPDIIHLIHCIAVYYARFGKKITKASINTSCCEKNKLY